MFGKCLGISWYFLFLIINELNLFLGNVWEFRGNCLGNVWEFERDLRGILNTDLGILNTDLGILKRGWGM
jgi:hypothetical protein